MTLVLKLNFSLLCDGHAQPTALEPLELFSAFQLIWNTEFRVENASEQALNEETAIRHTGVAQGRGRDLRWKVQGCHLFRSRIGLIPGSGRPPGSMGRITLNMLAWRIREQRSLEGYGDPWSQSIG